jgi:hypothetical protein
LLDEAVGEVQRLLMRTRAWAGRARHARTSTIYLSFSSCLYSHCIRFLACVDSMRGAGVFWASFWNLLYAGWCYHGFINLKPGHDTFCLKYFWVFKGTWG